jgi:hypothetical protein
MCFTPLGGQRHTGRSATGSTSPIFTPCTSVWQKLLIVNPTSIEESVAVVVLRVLYCPQDSRDLPAAACG